MKLEGTLLMLEVSLKTVLAIGEVLNLRIQSC